MTTMAPMRLSSRSIGTASERSASLRRAPTLSEGTRRSARHVVHDVDDRSLRTARLAICDTARGHRVACAPRPRRASGVAIYGRATACDQLAVEPEDTADEPPHRRTALSAIASKTGWTSVGELDDDPQDLARGGLLLERLGHLGMRFCERSVLLLQLREQPHVLDRDDRLVGEGLAAARSAWRRRARARAPEP